MRTALLVLASLIVAVPALADTTECRQMGTD
jgi:hypothetical protein